MKQKTVPRHSAWLLACFLCLMLVAGCGTSPQGFSSAAGASEANTSGGMASRAPMWELQPDELVRDTPVGPFRFLDVLNNYRTQSLLLFYAVPGNQRETPQVTSKIPTANVRSIKELGMVGAFHVGVLEVQWQSQIDQTVVLAFSFPKNNAAWTMAPLKQMRGGKKEESYEGYGLPASVATNAPIEVQEYGGQGLTNLKIAIAKGQPQQTPLFVHVNQDSTVSVVSEEEFSQFTAPAPITAGPAEPQPTMELPPATYAPTPTLPPYPAPGAAQAYPVPEK
jgi:hypothetical protein